MKKALAFSLITLLFIIGIAIAGGAFYELVLHKFLPENQPEPPKPKPKTKPPKRKKDESIPKIVALPGTTVVRLAHQTSNAHQAWALANMGKITDPGSIFAKNGITMQFRRLPLGQA